MAKLLSFCFKAQSGPQSCRYSIGTVIQAALEYRIQVRAQHEMGRVRIRTGQHAQQIPRSIPAGSHARLFHKLLSCSHGLLKFRCIQRPGIGPIRILAKMGNIVQNIHDFFHVHVPPYQFMESL